MNLVCSSAIHKRWTNLVCCHRFCKTPFFLKVMYRSFLSKKEKLFAFSVSILWSVPKGGQTSYISSTCIWTHPITDITYRPGQNTQLSLLLFPTVKKYLSVDCYGNFANTIRFMAKQFLFKILLFVYCELTKSKYKLEQPELCREIWGLSVSCAEAFGETGLWSSEREDSERFWDVIVAPRRFLQM